MEDESWTSKGGRHLSSRCRLEEDWYEEEGRRKTKGGGRGGYTYT